MKELSKVKPKFHEGDWAVSNLDGKARQISEVHFDEYNSYYVVDGKSVNLEEYDRLHHLRTIQDVNIIIYHGNELIDYAGADGWASMLRHEWHLPQFPFVFCQKLTK